MKNIFVFPTAVAVFFALAIFQSSFLPHLFWLPNLVFVAFLIIAFFGRQWHWAWKIAYATAAGFLIDVFYLSSWVPYMGLAILACLAMWIVVAGLEYFFYL